MRFFLFICAFLVMGAATSDAKPVCYGALEAEAEQGIRIHSELMVIGLNCSHMSDANGNNLYGEHRKFTNKHTKLFETYEKIVMDFMRKHGTKDTEAAMHALRTKFANKISNDVAQMRPDIFCRTYSSRIEKAAKMNEKQIRIWAATPYAAHPVSKPLCVTDKTAEKE